MASAYIELSWDEYEELEVLPGDSGLELIIKNVPIPGLEE